MNDADLKRLGEHALAFAKCYVALVEALVSQGVPEEIARTEARWCALAVAVEEPSTEQWDKD